MPEAVPTVATVAGLLLQVPPPASYNGTVIPVHKTESPIIGDGAGLTVTLIVEKHPVPSV